ERRIAAAEQRVAAAEQRGQAAEQRAEAAEQRSQAAEASAQTVAHQLAALQTHIVALEREVASADNVRSFAAETEREIASLQLERDDVALRRQLAEAEERARLAAIDLPDDDRAHHDGHAHHDDNAHHDDHDMTRTGNQLPIAVLAEHVNTLEESIDSLRANMR